MTRTRGLFLPDVGVELEVGEEDLLTDGALVLAPVVPLLRFDHPQDPYG